jgi:hypothetical protein
MWFQEKVSVQFAEKVKAIAQRLGMVPDFIMAVMDLETGGTFSPSIKNPLSTATGLIQFMAATANALGTTTANLAKMSAVDQLDYVERYFQGVIKQHGPLQTLENTYLAVFYPVAIKWALSKTFPVSVYNVNKGFDINKDATITKQEVSDKLYAHVKKKGYDVEKEIIRDLSIYLIVGSIVIAGVTAYVVVKK